MEDFPLLPRALQSYIANADDVDEQLPPSERYLPGSKLKKEEPEPIDLNMNVAVDLIINQATRPNPINPNTVIYGYEYSLQLQNIETKEISYTTPIFVEDDSGKEHIAIKYTFMLNSDNWHRGTGTDVYIDGNGTIYYPPEDEESNVYYQLSPQLIGFSTDNIIDLQPNTDGLNSTEESALFTDLSASYIYGQYILQNSAVTGQRILIQALRRKPTVNVPFVVLIRSDTIVNGGDV